MSGCRDNFLPFLRPLSTSLKWGKKMWKNTEEERNHSIREAKKRNRKDLLRGSSFFWENDRSWHALILATFSEGRKREFKFVFIYFYEKCTKTASGGCQMSEKELKSSACKSNCDLYSSKNMKHSLGLDLHLALYKLNKLLQLISFLKI